MIGLIPLPHRACGLRIERRIVGGGGGWENASCGTKDRKSKRWHSTVVSRGTDLHPQPPQDSCFLWNSQITPCRSWSKTHQSRQSNPRDRLQCSDGYGSPTKPGLGTSSGDQWESSIERVPEFAENQAVGWTSLNSCEFSYQAIPTAGEIRTPGPEDWYCMVWSWNQPLTHNRELPFHAVGSNSV